MEFYEDDIYYLYLENRGEKSVVKLQRDYYWTEEHIDGVCFDLGTLFSHLDIEDIVDSLRRKNDLVEVIDECEIDNYMED
jgi:hypothetical protein